MKTPNKLTILGLIAGVLIGVGGLVAAQALRTDVETRIVARPQADGDIEVALQQRDANGDWDAALIRPDARFVPADAAVGEWLFSSSVTVSGPAVDVVRTVERAARGWEVWLSDQADSAGIDADNPSGTHGGRILIYESSDILAAPPGTYAEDDPRYGPTVIEATDIFPSAFEELGVNVRRIHGILVHPPTHRYLSANFFGPGEGLVGIIDAEGQCTELGDGLRECRRISGEPQAAAKLAKALFRTTGPEGSAPSNHMSFFTADGTKLIVANLGAKLLERIDYDAATDSFIFNKSATLDLVGERDLTALEAAADPTLPGGRVSGEYANFQPTTTPSGALREARSGATTSSCVPSPAATTSTPTSPSAAAGCLSWISRPSRCRLWRSTPMT